eukprot:scaffold113302_cov63-Phaeocystis_antarctica.AAC.3
MLLWKPSSIPRRAWPCGVESASFATLTMRSGTAWPVRKRATWGEGSYVAAVKRGLAVRRKASSSASLLLVVPRSSTSHASIGTAAPAGVTQMPPPKKYSSRLPPPQSTTTPVCGMMSTCLPTTDCDMTRARPLLRSYTATSTRAIANVAVAVRWPSLSPSSAVMAGLVRRVTRTCRS